ncbi:MAG: MMPL family transporter [Acidimicrobiia bacterium]|nr:MMPL family transporter [Acidimicrobiia bacterium]
MLGGITDFVSSRRGKWVTFLIWVVAAGALIYQLPQLADLSENDRALFLPANAESTRAFEFEKDRFPASGTPVLIVVREEAGISPATWTGVGELEAWLNGPAISDAIRQVRAPSFTQGSGSDLVSADGSTLYVFVDLSGEPAESEFADHLNSIRDQSAMLKLPGVEVAVGGSGGLTVDLVGVFDNINSLLLIVTVLLVLVLLILIYRSPIVALIPLASVGLVFALAGAVGAALAQQFDLPLSEQTTGIMTVILFGTGTDYVLFVSARYREELTRHVDKHEAMRHTMRGVGGAVASAGLTILIASAALGLATLRTYQSLGPVIAIAVALMMLAALTLVPALLTMIGRRAFWPKQPRYDPVAASPEDSRNWRRSIYGRIGGVVLSRPRVTLVLTTGLLALLILGLLRYDPNYDQLASLPDNTESVRSFELLREGFPAGELSPTNVYVDLPAEQQALQPNTLQQIDSFTLAIADHRGVASVSGPSRPFGTRVATSGGVPADGARFVSPDGGAVRLSVVLEQNPFSNEALNLMPELRERVRDAAAEVGFDPAGVWVGGDTAEAADTRSAGNRDMWVVLPLILVAIGVVLAILLRSLVAPLYLVATIAFTYFATLGLAVIIFLGLFDHAGIGPSTPFFLFVFLNALSVDYNIYLMSRIREEARGAPLKEATGHALALTGPVITSAGLILAGTFSALMALPLEDLVQLGFAVAAGVLIDTFITRTLIVPALVAIVGRWSWWPSRLAHKQPSPAIQ